MVIGSAVAMLCMVNPAHAGALGYVAFPFVAPSPNGAPALMDMQVGPGGTLEAIHVAQVGLYETSPGVNEHGALFAELNPSTQTIADSSVTGALPNTDFVRSFSYDPIGNRVVLEAGGGPLYYLGANGSNPSIVVPPGSEVSDNPWGSGDGIVIPFRDSTTNEVQYMLATYVPGVGLSPLTPFGPLLSPPGGDAFVNGNQTGVLRDSADNILSIAAWAATVTPDPPNPAPLFASGLSRIDDTTTNLVVALDFFDDQPASNPLARQVPGGPTVTAGIAKNLGSDQVTLYLNDQTATDLFLHNALPASDLAQAAINGNSPGGGGFNLYAATLTNDNTLRRWTFLVDLDPAGPTINLVNNELLLDTNGLVDGQPISSIFLDENGIDELGNIVVRIVSDSGDNYFGAFIRDIPEPTTATLLTIAALALLKHRH